jgi:hypothetical protein
MHASQSAAGDQKLLRMDLLILVCLGIAGIFFFFWKFQESFPSASIELKVDRAAAASAATQWCRRLGYNPDGAIVSTVFGYDDEAKTFLEYELGQARANALMKSQIPIWRWETRFCRPFQLEEIGVSIAPDGNLNSFNHSLPNDAPGKTVSHEQAQQIARDFVTRQLHLSLDGNTLVKDSEEKQIKRLDHYFTWEDPTAYKDGHLRTYVYVAGDQVTEYNRFLHIPEKFQRKYAEIRSLNELLKQVASIIYTVISSAIPFVFIWALATGRIRWKFVLGAAAIGVVISILSYIDAIPVLINNYRTPMGFQQYLMESALHALVSLVFTVVGVVLFIGALEPIYRMAFPKKIALEKLATTAGLRAKPVLESLIAGLATFGLHTAYVVAFYLIGQRVGFWSPLELRETSTLSGLWPFYSAIEVGVGASMTEELMYRVLGLWLFRRLTGNFWIANLLQAASWAFMHSDYPQEPAYVRGVELTIGGFFYGYILRRYGLPACILAHYTYDAFLGVTPLFSAHSLVDRLSALIAVLPGVIALLVSVVLIRMRGKTQPADIEPLRNEAIKPVKREPLIIEPPTVPDFDYRPLSARLLTGFVIAALIGIPVYALVPLRTVGERNVVSISRDQAIAIARDFLEKRHAPLAGRQAVAVLLDESDDLQMQYVYEKTGYKRTAELARWLEPRLLWKVRFFKPHDPEEFYVTLTPSGKIYATYDYEEEDAPGGKPNEAEARAVVGEFLKTRHPELAPLVAEDMTKHEHKNRTDYEFTFKIPPLKVDQAEFKVSTGTVGSYPAGFKLSWQLPQSWIFERDKIKLKEQISDVARTIVNTAISIAMLWWVFLVLRRGHIRWRLPLTLALVTAVFIIARRLNDLPTIFWSYKTEVPTATFLTQAVIQDVIMVLSGACATGFFTALAISAYSLHYPEVSFASIVKTALPHVGKVTAATRRMWLDAVIASSSLIVVAGAVDRLIDSARFYMSPAVHLLSLSDFRSLSDQWSPAVGAILGAISGGFYTTIVAMVLACVARHYFGRRVWRMFAVVAVCSMIVYSSLRYWQDYVWNLVSLFGMGGFFYLFAVRVARLNILAYLLAGYFAALLSAGVAIFRFEDFALAFPQLALLAVAFLLPFAYTAWLYRAPARELEIVPPNEVAS